MRYSPALKLSHNNLTAGCCEIAFSAFNCIPLRSLRVVRGHYSTCVSHVSMTLTPIVMSLLKCILLSSTSYCVSQKSFTCFGSWNQTVDCDITLLAINIHEYSSRLVYSSRLLYARQMFLILLSVKMFFIWMAANLLDCRNIHLKYTMK